MTRLEITEQIGNVIEKNCKSCEKKRTTKGYSEFALVCRRCPIHKEIRSLGKEIEKLERSNKLTERQLFYLVNHLDVLGLERGLKQVKKHFKQHTYSALKAEYYLEKKKTRHIAV